VRSECSATNGESVCRTYYDGACRWVVRDARAGRPEAWRGFAGSKARRRGGEL